MTLQYTIVLGIELLGEALLFLALVGVAFRMLFIKSNAYTFARTVELPLLASIGFIWVVFWCMVRMATLLVLSFVADSVLVEGELPLEISIPLNVVIEFGLALFLASVIVRCWRLLLIFLVNEKIHKRLQAQALKYPQCALRVSPASPQAPESSECHSCKHDKKPGETSFCSKQSSMVKFLLLRSRMIKKGTKAPFTVPATIVLSIVLFIVIVGRVPFMPFLASHSLEQLLVEIVGAALITALVGIQAAISAILLMRVDEVFNQSRELWLLLIVSLSASLTQLTHIIPFWPSAFHEMGVIVTGTIFLFSSGVYSLRQALRFRRIQLENVVPSVENVEEFLQQPIAIQFFAAYIKREYAHENLLFYIDCRKFRSLAMEGKRKECRKLAENIMARYFGSNAHFELNLPGPLAQEVAERANRLFKANEDLPSDLFAPAEKVVLNSLAFDTFPRFKASSVFEELKRRLVVEQHVIDGIM